MYRSAYFLLYTLLFCIILYSNAYSCTGVKLITSNGVFVAGNEDYNKTFRDVIARVRPAVNGNYGYIATGFERHDYFMMGLNDQGLFVDMFTVPSCYQWEHDPEKKDYDGFLEEKMLSECANCDEAIDFYHSYNHPAMVSYSFQIFLVDSSGNSAVINWGDGDIEVVRSQDDFQLVTNFFLLHPECGWCPCWRYATATEMIENADKYNFRLLRDILKQVNLSSNYSQICNLNNGDIFVFYNHNFDEYVRMNLYTQLAKGEMDFEIADYCAQLKLINPQDGAVISDSNEVVFQWEGVAFADYQLLIADNPDFFDCKPITGNNLPVMVSSVSGLWNLAAIFPCILLFIMFIRRKFLLNIFLSILIIGVLYSCKIDRSMFSQEPDRSIKTLSKSVSNLEPGTTYYWKIVAETGNGLVSESIVHSFSIEK